MPIKGPFLVEMERIIRLERPSKHGPRTAVLVSPRYYREVKDFLEDWNDEFGGPCLKTASILLRGCLLAAAPWLTDYEFEVRPPV